MVKKKQKSNDNAYIKRMCYTSIIFSLIVLLTIIVLFLKIDKMGVLVGEATNSDRFKDTSVKHKNLDLIKDPDQIRDQLIDYIDLLLKDNEGGNCCIDTEAGNEPTKEGEVYILDSTGEVITSKSDTCKSGTFTEYYCQNNEIKVTMDKCHTVTGVYGCNEATSSCNI